MRGRAFTLALFFRDGTWQQRGHDMDSTTQDSAVERGDSSYGAWEARDGLANLSL